MFGKKKCQKCGKKTESGNFCSNCGASLNKNLKKDFGMLGTNDLEERQGNNPLANTPFAGIGGNMLGKMLNNTMKMLEKEMQKEFSREQQPNMNHKFELYINGKKIDPKKIKVTSKQLPPKQEIQKKKPTPKEQGDYVKTFDAKNKKVFLERNKTEPKTSLKRLGDRVIYEITIPGVKKLEDISIIKLENSIEVKALSEKKAYQKLIPISLPIMRYALSSGKLTLELDAGS